MTAASIEEDPEQMKDLLDDLIGEEPEDHPDDLESADIDEPTPEPKAEEPEPIAAKEEVEDDDEEPGNLRLPEKEEAKAEDEPAEPEADLSDDAKRLAAEEKRTAGLKKELHRLRTKNAELAAMNQPTAPPPAIPAAPQVPTSPVADPSQASADPNRIPVVVSEDGQSVYVDEAKLAERMQQTALSAYEEASRPTPEQISAQNEMQLAQAFIGQNKEQNEPVYQMAREAENFIFEAVSVGAKAQGAQLDSVQKIQAFIHQNGIDQQVQEFFPNVGPLIDEFVAAGISENPMWRKSVLERMVPSAPPELPSGESGAVEPVSGAPLSLARKGAARSTSSNADESEFMALEKEFQDDPFEMSEKRVARMEALGKKLGIVGME